MADNAQETAQATGELIEKMYFEEGKSIAEIMDGTEDTAGMSLGDIRFEVDLIPGRKPLPLEFRSARIMVTFGGPTTWVHSTGEVVSYWGTEEGHWCLPVGSGLIEDLEEYCREIYNAYTESE